LPAAPAGRTTRGAAAGDAAGPGLRGSRAHHGRADRHGDVEAVAGASPPARSDGRQADARRPVRSRPAAIEVIMAMKEDSPLLPDEAELHAYVDGSLDDTRRAAVAARLASDAEAAARVQAGMAQREALR